MGETRRNILLGVGIAFVSLSAADLLARGPYTYLLAAVLTIGSALIAYVWWDTVRTNRLIPPLSTFRDSGDALMLALENEVRYRPTRPSDHNPATYGAWSQPMVTVVEQMSLWHTDLTDWIRANLTESDVQESLKPRPTTPQAPPISCPPFDGAWELMAFRVQWLRSTIEAMKDR